MQRRRCLTPKVSNFLSNLDIQAVILPRYTEFFYTEVFLQLLKQIVMLKTQVNFSKGEI